MSTSKPGYCGELPPGQFNLARYCLAASAKKFPDKTALIIARDTDCERWTYKQIADAVLRIANGLQQTGLKAGDRLFIRMGNCIDYALMFFAANAAGLVPVAASSALGVHEAAMMISDCRARAIVADGSLELPGSNINAVIIDADTIAGLKQSARGSWAGTRRDDPAYMVYTSGTSGSPKGVVHAQRAVWGRRPMYQGWYGISANDRLLHTGAFNWTFTLGTGLSDPWANGATAIVYTGKKNIHIWPRLIRNHAATIIAGVPSLYRQILKYCDPDEMDFPTLRHGLAAGEPLPVHIANSWRERTGTELLEALGMSEISTYISTAPGGPSKPGSPGRAQPGRCVAIVGRNSGHRPLERGSQGVLAVHRSDPGLMLGYFNNAQEQAEMMRGDWFITGDMACMDEDGFIFFEGRLDDLMNASGYRVSPLEVERALERHQAVAAAGVCVLQKTRDVAVIAAFVVRQKGNNVSANELVKSASRYLAGYKLPREVVFVPHLPYNTRGKLARNKLPGLSGDRFKVQKIQP